MRFLFVAMLLSSQVHAWGPIGHRVVAQLAQQRLSPVATARLKVIMGKDSLADVALWPDDIRSDDHWKHAAPWHYVSVEDGKSYDPKNASKTGDVVEVIERFSRTLTDAKYPVDKKKEAIKFLVHFVGDVHMPLHVGRADDMGGNKILLDWFGTETNLHAIWDEKMIDMEKLSFTEYARFIDKASPEREKDWASTPLYGWVEESMALRSQVYAFPTSREKGWEYVYRYKNMPTVNQRLQQAGVRLATLLNTLLKNKLKK